MNKYYKLNFVLFFMAFFYGVSDLTSVSNDRTPASRDRDVVGLINYQRNYIGISDDIEVGNFAHLEGRDSEYMQRLFGEIIQEAHRLASKDFYFPKNDKFRFYNSFLMNAIIVPYHESSLMHITRRATSFCYLANDLSDKKFHRRNSAVQFIQEILMTPEGSDLVSKIPLLSNSSSRTLRAWLDRKIAHDLDKGMSTFLSKTGFADDVFPACHKFKGDKFNQLLFAGDYADVGLYQLNSFHHHEMMTAGKIFNTSETIKYGLKYLYEGGKGVGGFKALARNHREYSCLRENKNSFKLYREINRGNWAGQFNSGRLDETCRFTNFFMKDARDESFLQSLDTLIMNKQEQLRSNPWKLFLPDNSIEKKAYFELVNNYTNLKNNRKYLDQVLMKDYSNLSNIKDTVVNRKGLEKIAKNVSKEVEEDISDRLDREFDLESDDNSEQEKKDLKFTESKFILKCNRPQTIKKGRLKRPLFVKEKVSSQIFLQDEFVGPGEVEIVDEENIRNEYFWYATFNTEDCQKRWFYSGKDHKDIDIFWKK